MLVGRASHLWQIVMYWLIAILYLYKFGIFIIPKSFAYSIIYFESYICIYIYFCLPLICSSLIYDSVLPSVHVKLLSGQCPAWGVMEPFLEGRWYKFINNDGQEVALDLPEQVTEFSEKSISFAHWAFNYFKERALVCDLQGN